MRKILFLVLTVIIVASCNDDEEVILSYDEQLKIDIEKIKDYLDENELTADSTASGLFYIIDEEGTGSQPTVDSLVTVTYVGKFLANEEVFDQGTVESYPLRGLIYGWREGIALFKEGGSGTLFIPSGLAYGPYGSRSVPGNAVLIFDIELLDVESVNN